MRRLRGRYEVTKKIELEAHAVEGGGVSRGHIREADGFLECEFELIVDEEKLLRQMGRKAAFSARGVSVIGRGAVKLKVVKKTRVPE